MSLIFLLTVLHVVASEEEILAELSIVAGLGGDDCKTVCNGINLDCSLIENGEFSDTFNHELFYIMEFAPECEFLTGVTLKYDKSTGKCVTGDFSCDVVSSLDERMMCACNGLKQQAEAKLSDHWFQIHDRQYHAENIKGQMNFAEAETYCRQKSGHPLVIKNDKQHQALTNFASEKFGVSSKILLYWNAGVWKDTNQVPAFDHWAQGEPTKQCAYLDISTGKWMTQECSDIAFVICRLTTFRWWKTNWGYFSHHKKRSFNGTSIHIHTVKSMHHCVKKCRSNIECLSANYDDVKKECALFAQIGTAHLNDMHNIDQCEYLERNLHSEFYDKANSMLTDFCLQKQPCENGATCINDFNSFKCICTSEYQGLQCETPKPCHSLIEPNGMISYSDNFNNDGMISHNTTVAMICNETHYASYKKEIDGLYYTEFDPRAVCTFGNWNKVLKCTAIPFHRQEERLEWYNPSRVDYLYLPQSISPSGLSKTGEKWSSISGGTECPEKILLHRFYKAAGTVHLLTDSLSQKASLMANPNWVYEPNNAGGYCVRRSGECGLIGELWRFYKPTGDAFRYLRNSPPINGFNREGIQCYIF